MTAFQSSISARRAAGECFLHEGVGFAVEKLGMPFARAHHQGCELVEAARSVEIETGIRIVAGRTVDTLAAVIVMEHAQRFEIAREILPAITRTI